MVKREKLSWTTAADGSATVTGASIVGEICAIDYLPGTTDTGATFTVSDVGAMTHTILSKATAGTSNVRFYPRELVQKAEDGANLTGTAGGDRCEPFAAGKLQVVIASGGNVTAGSVIVYYE